MTRRVLPQPDLYASCPGDEAVLAYYAGAFDSAYVCFSPFIRPSRISPERFCPGMYPSDTELLSLCHPVTWAEVMELAALPSPSAVDLALKTQIHAVRSEFVGRNFADQLSALYHQGVVMPPTEGEQSPFLIEPVLSLFKDLGHEWAWVGDEFCTERKLHWIDDLICADPTPLRGHANVFTPDKSLLWTAHWDSHFSLLCGPRVELERVKLAERLEGFFCTPQTEMYWSVHGV